MLNDPDGRIRQRAVFILGQVGTEASLAACEDALDDVDRDVRIMAGVGLAQYGIPRGIHGARAAVWASPDWLKAYAVYGLYRIDTPAAKRLLETVEAEGNPFISQILDDARAGQGRYQQFDFPAEIFTDISTWADARDAAVDALVTEADVWFHAGEYDQAIRANQAALFLNPHVVELYGNNGWLQWSMGRHGAAIETYRRGIAANPAAWEAYFELGFYYFRHDQANLALDPLKRAVKLGAPPQFARTYAHALERTGRLQQCLEMWHTLDDLDGSGVVDQNIRRLQDALAARGRCPNDME
jgi:tetratricopeptide (TPR) repeat protein